MTAGYRRAEAPAKAVAGSMPGVLAVIEEPGLDRPGATVPHRFVGFATDL
jgi:hypothetical protein